jgi:uracil phosphoribosyltransferase
MRDTDGVTVIDNPLAQDLLTVLRDAETDDARFREGLRRLGHVCGVELAGRLPAETVDVQTPLAGTTGTRLRADEVVFVSVLRAAVPFVAGLLDAVPRARQGVVSASRQEAAGMDAGTFPIEVEYTNLPAVDGDTVVVADPMLATGSTMCAVLDAVTGAGDPGRLVVLSVVSAPPGIDRVAEAFPGVDLVTAAVDDRLNDEGFIVPGLGDAGDRAFGTGE